MKRLSYAILFLLAGCESIDIQTPAGTTSELLSGQRLFGEEVPAAPAVDVLALSEEMRAWVELKSAAYPHAESRMRRLLRGMIEDGLLSLEYDLDLSLTAQETFTRHQGNCLSFSLLFVALAREANINVTFQMVEIPPSFSAGGELVLLNNHINVLVSAIRTDVNYLRGHVVDFNNAEYNGNYKTHKVTDDYAMSLYHGNIAVEALQRRNYREAFQQLKRGIEVSADIAGLWVNLGVLYSRNNQFTMAESAYKHALTIDPRNKSALVNLVNVSGYLGKNDEAARYEKRVQRYLKSNPYYHQHRAQRALDSQLLDEALREIKRAIALKDDEHQFYHLEGLVHTQAGRSDSAQKSFLKAQRTARREDIRKTYARKLRALDANPG